MDLRTCAEQIRNAAIDAVNPEHAVQRFLSSHPEIFDSTNTIDLVAIGKAAIPMLRGMIEYSEEAIHTGVVATKEGSTFGYTHPSIDIYESGHPVPNQASVISGQKILKFVKESSADTIVFLISGGSSAIITVPQPPMTIKDMQVLTQQLLASGAPIHEINTVRKHLDLVKGGGLLHAIQQQKTIITLVLSDVVGDDLSIIGSGPTYWDDSTIEDAQHIMTKYAITTAIPFRETAKQTDPVFKHCHYYLVGNGRIAVDAAVTKATELGFTTNILSYTQQGEAQDIGTLFAKTVATEDATCIVFGGETTVTLGAATGKGGRNQELVLAAGMHNTNENILFYSFGTDGIDGPTDAAGALFDTHIRSHANKHHILPQIYLNNHDSYTFFEKTNGLVKIGSTGTNVGDVTFALKRINATKKGPV